MSKNNIDKCYEYFNKKNFSIVLISNIEKMLLGNEKEKLKVEFIDGKKNDASGSDECFISITGDTIISPKIKNFFIVFVFTIFIIILSSYYYYIYNKFIT